MAVLSAVVQLPNETFLRPPALWRYDASGGGGAPHPDGIAENVYTIRLAPGDGRLFALAEQRREDWPTPRGGFGVSVGGVSVGVGR
jgi:hypothetical protein